ncbi:MAG: hypothetical protein ACLQAH_12110 [Limisphaerales bacterium]
MKVIEHLKRPWLVIYWSEHIAAGIRRPGRILPLSALSHKELNATEANHFNAEYFIFDALPKELFYRDVAWSGDKRLGVLDDPPTEAYPPLP